MKFITAIHGINTKLTRPSWPWWFQAHGVKSKFSALIQTEHYWAFPFPMWNNLILNPKYAKALAKRTKLLADELPGTPVQFVAHSNGSNIAVETVKRLAELGIRTDTVILIGSAVKSDVKESGLLSLYEANMVDRVFAYISDGDEVITPLKWLPGRYGNLGVTGFSHNGSRFGYWLGANEPATEDRGFFVRQFPGFGHSGYFEGLALLQTFRLIFQDLRLQKMR